MLYNVALLAQHGASALSAVWDSGTIWSGPQPLSLRMQSVSPVRVAAASPASLSSPPVLPSHEASSVPAMRAQPTLLKIDVMPQDCNLVFYDAGGANQANAIFYTATYDGTGPCALSVSSSGGGFITVADFNHTVLYLAPTGFGVLIDENYNATYNINGTGAYDTLDYNELYDVATGVASQTATNLNQYQYSAADRTFLPTIGAVLSVGDIGFQASASSVGGPYVNSELFLTASQTWASAGTQVGGNTDELNLVTLFSGNALLIGSSYHYINASYQLLHVGQPDLLCRHPLVERDRSAARASHGAGRLPPARRQGPGLGRATQLPHRRSRGHIV